MGHHVQQPGWSTQQRGHHGAREKAIAALEQMIQQLRDAPEAEFEDPEDQATYEEIAALGPVQEWREAAGADDTAETAPTPRAKRRKTSAARPTRGTTRRRKGQARRPLHVPPELDGTPTTVPSGPSTSF